VHWCAVWKHTFQKYFWSTPLTRICIGVTERSVLSLLFLRSLSILSGCYIINICFGHQDTKLWWIGPMAYHTHTKFHYPKLLTCVMNMEALSIFQAWVCMEEGIGKFFLDIYVKTFSPWKVHVLGACLHLAGCLLHCVPVMDWIL